MDAIDLHVHSTFSDGTLTPSELISRAKQFHLAAMALTDHDTIEGIPEAVQAASEQNLELVPGVELSTTKRKSTLSAFLLIIRTKPSKKNWKVCVMSAVTATLPCVKNLHSLAFRLITVIWKRNMPMPSLRGRILRITCLKKAI